MRIDVSLEIDEFGTVLLEAGNKIYMVDDLEVKDFLEWVVRDVVSE